MPFDASDGSEAVLREIVSTVGEAGMAGERVHWVVSVQMLTEGWNVKSVSHILGIRAFGSPLLTELIIGRRSARTNYDAPNQPLNERPEAYKETVDAFGIPFVGFSAQKHYQWYSASLTRRVPRPEPFARCVCRARTSGFDCTVFENVH